MLDARGARALIFWPLAVTLAAAGAACGGQDGEVCLSDRSCGAGRRCEETTRGEPKICVPCDPDEVPYDGLDNDCNTRTPDSDLDGDGDNAADSPVRPGTDCDDNDPAINVRALEVCDDSKDNNCNGMIDEPQCRDRNPPMISILRPMNNELVSGIVDVVVMTNDDTTVVELEMFVNGNSISTTAMANTTFMLDTSTFPDGPISIRIDATDLADRTARAEVMVNLDNHTPPQISVAQPTAGASYAGTITLEADATDAAGVETLEIGLDGTVIVTTTTTPYRITVDTSTLTEGAHTANFRAVDANGNVSTSDIGFLVDRTGPVITMNVFPVTGTQVSGVFSVNVTGSDPAGVGYVESTTGVITQSAMASSLLYSVDTLAPPRLPNGPLTISALARDNTIVDGMLGMGNVSTTTVSVDVLNIPPEPIVTFVTPQDTWGVFRDTEITATVTSPVGNAITRVDFSVNDSVIYSDTTAPYTTDFDFTDYVDTATISVLAVDDELYETTVSIVVRIVPPPTFRLTPQARPIGTITNNGYAIGDLNGDSIPDAVTAGSDLSFFEGEIDPIEGFRFAPARRIGGASLDVRLANVDIHAALDLIVLTTSALEVHTNNGNGTFNAPVTTPVGITTPSDLEIGDLNGDGDVDIVVGSNGAGSGDVRVFLQSSGLFPSGLTYGTVGTVTDIVLANVDGDGDLDIALGRSGSAVASVYRNNGSGAFGAAQDSFAIAAPQRVVAGDVTGDGYPDLVVTQPTAHIEVLEGSPLTPGTFTTLGRIPTRNPVTGLVLGDLDGDLDLDVAFTTVNTVDMMLNDGAGNFTPYRSFTIARSLLRPSLVDLDGDGERDLIVSSSSDNGLAYAIRLATGDYLAAPEIAVPRAAAGLAAGDLVGNDGRVDLAMTSPAPAGAVGALPDVSVFANSAVELFPLHVTLNLPAVMTQPRSIAVGDLDGANAVDIAVGSSNTPTMNSPTVATFLSNGTDGFTSSTPYSVERPISVAIGDVDNDGVGDLVCTEDFSIAAMADGSRVFAFDAMTYSVARGFGAVSIAIGDLDNDQINDYAVANSVTNDITVNLWTGTGYATATFNALPGISAITIGRVGEDDVNDIVGVSSTGGVIIMEGDPSFGFATPVPWPAGPSPSGVVGGDFNRDGLYDVMVMNPATDTVSLLVASPQGGFFEPVTISTVDAPAAFVVADFDQDGRSDVAVASGSGGALMIIFNNIDSL